jgi:hypothetical protein
MIQLRRIRPVSTSEQARQDVSRSQHRSTPSGAPVTAQGKSSTTDRNTDLPAPRHVAWTFVRTPGKLNAADQATLTRVQQDPQIVRVSTLAQQFQQMVRTRQAAHLSRWLAACTTIGVPDLQTFAAALSREEAAIRQARTEPWSTGPVEGHVTRVKLVKRQMFEWANVDLLRQRVLHTA